MKYYSEWHLYQRFYDKNVLENFLVFKNVKKSQK